MFGLLNRFKIGYRQILFTIVLANVLLYLYNVVYLNDTKYDEVAWNQTDIRNVLNYYTKRIQNVSDIH